ncbi:hypothetical protein [Herbaspirillum camelliae]|uniref:hypothetical protein n=1 Tax=Herbaspirillum camelliae TaxID=1892903 RepID=UPI00117B17AD|nr:hypothetical protein [Herbaspirillum camelliae]
MVRDDAASMQQAHDKSTDAGQQVLVVGIIWRFSSRDCAKKYQPGRSDDVEIAATGALRCCKREKLQKAIPQFSTTKMLSIERRHDAARPGTGPYPQG